MDNRTIAELLGMKLRQDENSTWAFYDSTGLLTAYGSSVDEAIRGLPDWIHDSAEALKLTKPDPSIDLVWTIVHVYGGYWVKARFWDSRYGEFREPCAFNAGCAEAICTVFMSLAQFAPYMQEDVSE